VSSSTVRRNLRYDARIARSRTWPTGSIITPRINGIHMHYVEQGEGMPVVLCHGFPHLWFSWRRQISALAAAGYRVIAPDMRGMGQTEAPPDPADYDIDHITADLLGLLDHLGVERAVFAGLDFGAFAIYDLALRHPARVIAVIGLENPAAPHNPEEPPLTEYRRIAQEHFLHIEYFRVPPRADEELAAAAAPFPAQGVPYLERCRQLFRRVQLPARHVLHRRDGRTAAAAVAVAVGAGAGVFCQRVQSQRLHRRPQLVPLFRFKVGAAQAV
jgi:pimeloyl-ACP methyl ester carboxylesterase